MDMILLVFLIIIIYYLLFIKTYIIHKFLPHYLHTITLRLI
jgi:hypothetical protein